MNICDRWPIVKIEAFNSALGEKEFKKNQIIYEQGDQSEVFYIVKSGKLKLQTAVDYKSYNRYPIGTKLWEVLITTKRILHTLKYLGPGDICGQEELLKGIRRMTRLSCDEDSVVLYLNKSNFLELFTSEDIDRMKDNYYKINPHKIGEEVEQEENFKKMKRNVFLDAVNLNLPSQGEINGRDPYPPNTNKTTKLKPWLQSLNHNNLNKSKSNKVLRIMREKYVIDEFDHMNNAEINEAMKKKVAIVSSLKDS